MASLNNQLSCSKCAMLSMQNEKHVPPCRVRKCFSSHYEFDGYQIHIELWFFLRSESIKSLSLGSKLVDDLKLTYEEMELLVILDGEFNRWHSEKIKAQQQRSKSRHGR